MGSDVEEWGHHYNITTFTLLSNATINITRFYNFTQGGWLIINATNINISGNITGDGKGYAGGPGSGGGGGGVGSGGSGNIGGGGTGGVNWEGFPGCTDNEPDFNCEPFWGFSGERSVVTSGKPGGVANGYVGSIGIYYMNSSTVYAFINGGIEGASGNNAPVNIENSTAPNATMGGGGSGGGGGRGGNGYSSGNRGGGGGGAGGAGGDGGAYVIFIASQKITINSGSIINMRAGLESCAARTGSIGGNAAAAKGGNGGTGGSSNGNGNCLPGSGGNGGQSAGSSSTDGSAGASGGYGAAGMIVAYAPNITIGSNANFSVSDNIGGGSIKLLYRTNLTNSGTFIGYSNLLSTSYNNAPGFSDVVITPSPATQANNLFCNYTATDVDGDTLSISINWTVNGAISSFHTQTLGVGNYSNGQVVSCQVLANDGFTTSGWVTSSNLTLNDATNPLVNNYTASTYTPSSTTAVTFTVNVSDAGSSISSTACRLQFSKSDFDGGNGLGVAVNYTTNTLTDTQLVSRSINMATFGTGILTWEYVHCFDDSGNKNTTQVNQNLTITTATTSSPAAGGGGSGTTPGQQECEILIVRPRSSINSIGITSLPGDYSPWQTIVLENQETYENTYTFSTDASYCQINQTSITLLGQAQGSNSIRCKLPQDNTETYLKIDCEANNVQLKINLYSDFFSFLYANPVLLALAVGLFTAFLAGLYALYIVASTPTRRR